MGMGDLPGRRHPRADAGLHDAGHGHGCPGDSGFETRVVVLKNDSDIYLFAPDLWDYVAGL